MMATKNWKPTNYPGIYEYSIKSGKRYSIRLRYKKNGKYAEKSEAGFKTIAAAKTKKSEYENLIQIKKGYVFENGNLTLNEWHSEYMEIFRAKDYSKDTIKNKETMYKNHIKEQFGNIPLQKIALDYYEKYLLSKLKEGYSRNTVLGIHRTMKAIMNAAVKYEKIDKNRLKNIELKESSDNYVVKTQILEDEEFRLFTKACKESLSKYDYTMIHLAIWGLRRGEVMGIRVENLKFDTKNRIVEVHINSSRTLNTPEGKGTKTISGVRTLTFSGEGYDLLLYSLNKAKSIAKDFGMILNSKDFVFRSPFTNKPWAVTRMNDILNKINKAYGLKVHPHMLRHNFTTQAALSGVNKADLQKFIGHKNSAMTEYYTHSTSTGTEKLFNIMQEKLSQK